MKTRKLNKKLHVNKRTISNLEMQQALGGGITDPDTGVTVVDHTCEGPFCSPVTRVDSRCVWCSTITVPVD